MCVICLSHFQGVRIYRDDEGVSVSDFSGSLLLFCVLAVQAAQRIVRLAAVPRTAASYVPHKYVGNRKIPFIAYFFKFPI